MRNDFEHEGPWDGQPDYQHKPAATGSGEPRECEWCQGTGVALAGHPDEYCAHCNGTCYTVPTPPASQPTVTLDRETFDKAIRLVHRLKIHVGDDGLELWSDLVALLRAAEQK